MEDFGGLSFDDSLFCGGNVRESRRLVSYNYAKICEEGWFTQNVALHQKADVERLDVQKFSADQLYYQRDYSRALVIYRDMLGSIPPSNATVRRDVEEAIARCSLNLGEADAALDIALDMNKSVNPNNPDQQTVVWSLLRDVYKQMGKAQEYMRIQQDLVTLHPQNAHCWLELSDLYQKRAVLQRRGNTASKPLLAENSQIDTLLGNRTDKRQDDQKKAHSCVNRDTQWSFIQSGNSENSSDTCGEEKLLSCERKVLDLELRDGCGEGQREDCLTCACLIQARVLLQETERGCTSFCRQKNKKLQANILRQLADMGVPEHVVTEATKFLENRNEADTNIDTKSSDDPLEEQQDTFEDRWLSWASCLQMG
ncbi:uncharacterized protein C8orf76 homolog [Branchiostoma lanceolatum]|uniref:uncharacterized protein C8orf76 homolog n=1 Tax=Branchiostoma lanceolatum TaxID=7740 RepID=UPI003451A84B